MKGSPGEQLFARPSVSALADLRDLSPATLLAMAVCALVVVLDGAAGPGVNFVALLAVAPAIAALSASEAETGVVGAFCVVMALLSGLWNDNLFANPHLVSVLVVGSGALAGLWTAALRERLERANRAEALLAEAGTLLGDELDQVKRAGHIARIAVPDLGDVAALDLVQPDGTIHRESTASVDRSLATTLTRVRRRQPIDLQGPHPVAETIRTGSEQLLDPMSEEDLRRMAKGKADLNAMRKLSGGQTLIVPLKARESILGAMTLSFLDPQREYDHDARRLAASLAERCALALENARVHEEQAHIASVLQRSLMPVSLPDVAGFDTAYRFVAAGEANQVGGDFFDLFRSGRDSWTAVIGDVCGKGPEAAALTALARHTIRASESPQEPPSEVLSRLHDSIKRTDAEGRFCTAVLARVERPNGRARLQITIGGHPPPLAVRRDGTVEAVGEPGTLLGALDTVELSDATTQIGAGEAVVLFTDGLLESRDRSTQSDEGWATDLLGRANGHSAEWIADRLLTKALERQGGEPRDDIAIVVLRREP